MVTRFIKEVKTVPEVESAYYQNVEEVMREYSIMILVGCIMVLYFIFA